MNYSENTISELVNVTSRECIARGKKQGVKPVELQFFRFEKDFQSKMNEIKETIRLWAEISEIHNKYLKGTTKLSMNCLEKNPRLLNS